MTCKEIACIELGAGSHSSPLSISFSSNALEGLIMLRIRVDALPPWLKPPRKIPEAGTPDVLYLSTFACTRWTAASNSFSLV